MGSGQKGACHMKKLILAITALALSAPAFADRGNHFGPRYGYYEGQRVVHVVHRPAYRPVVYHVHRPAPRPVVVVQRPAPDPLLVFGAVLGAVLVHHAITGY